MFEFLPEEHQQFEVQEHLASFLKWVYMQNPDFQTSLKREELTTCWLQEIKHPQWMIERIEKSDLLFIANVNEYFEAYYDQAHILTQTVTPEFKPAPVQTKTIDKTFTGDITPPQYALLERLTKKFDRKVNLKSLSKKQASSLISELIALEKSQKVAFNMQSAVAQAQ